MRKKGILLRVFTGNWTGQNINDKVLAHPFYALLKFNSRLNIFTNFHSRKIEGCLEIIHNAHLISDVTFWRLMMWYGHVCRPHFLLPSLPEHILQYVLPKVKVINAKDIDDYQVLWIDCDVKSANTKNCTIWFVKKPCRRALTDWYCPFLRKKDGQ